MTNTNSREEEKDDFIQGRSPSSSGSESRAGENFHVPLRHAALRRTPPARRANPPGPISPAATDRPAAGPRRRPTIAGSPPSPAARCDPCSMNSTVAPAGVATTGTPSAMASKMALLSPSLWAGWAKTWALASKSWASATSPRKRTRSATCNSAARASSRDRSGPAAGNPQLKRLSRAGQQGRRPQQHVVRLAGNQRPDGDDPRTVRRGAGVGPAADGDDIADDFAAAQADAARRRTCRLHCELLIAQSACSRALRTSQKLPRRAARVGVDRQVAADAEDPQRPAAAGRPSGRRSRVLERPGQEDLRLLLPQQAAQAATTATV